MIRFVHDWPLKEGPFVIVFLSTYERKRDQRGAADFVDGRRLAVLMDDAVIDNKNNEISSIDLMKKYNDTTFSELTERS